MTTSIFFCEQTAVLQSIIFQAVAAAIKATLTSQSALNILFFYPDMSLSCQDSETYWLAVAYTTCLREIVTEQNARTIHENISSHLLDEAKEWWNRLDEITQTELTAHYNGVDA